MLDAFNAMIERSSAFFANERYQGIAGGISARRPIFKVLFPIVRWASRSRLGNLVLLVIALLLYRAIRVPSGEALFQIGLSQNNERAFRRINEASARQQWSASINGSPVQLSTRLRSLLHLSLLWRLAGKLQQREGNGPFAHVQLVLTLTAWTIFRTSDFRGVQCVCIASDHSPAAFALVSIAQDRGLKTCYVQHAPVADYFPPLIYDLSILFDRASRAKYEASAANHRTTNKGRVIILPPFDEEASLPDLPHRPAYRIGLCLSYLWDTAGVGKLVLELLDHPSVESIRLRRHPRCKASLATLLRDKRVTESRSTRLAEFAQECDIALVPNSGVAIELLHLGRPVMYTPGTDFIANDYYGFVREGIIPLFRGEWLTAPKQLRRFFGDEWKERYAAFDETIAEPLEVSRTRAGKAFRDLVETPRPGFARG
ncbi:hypothetical protein [Pelagerythrobacter rhizovicinus]|uniref:Glycosyltransferase family 1 protein n=1 Tax=Pelagerythrobacter rhizovicinus TaxID=2268576 RepID=A0A4Q2KHX3_9SPHN|nr:hypothetical protein [Pelagerythrobacter rhizovicinus]RXZ64758.1 hypothetical protein ETX26_12900 [Pelagerythrobacter rhizovicinus]